MYSHLLRGLVCPEAQCPTCTFDDGVGTEATQNACFVIIARIEIGNDSIIRVGQMGSARWTRVAVFMALAD